MSTIDMPANNDSLVLESSITCPKCGHAERQAMMHQIRALRGGVSALPEHPGDQNASHKNEK